MLAIRWFSDKFIDDDDIGGGEGMVALGETA
jgi:tRNA G37 N-methylase TrmD